MTRRLAFLLLTAVSTVLLAVAHVVPEQAQQGGYQIVDGIG